MNRLGVRKYKLSTDQVSSNMAGEVVILNHGRGIYYGLGEVGALVWSALENGPRSVEELCELVMEEYEVDQATCEKDIEALIESLLQEKLVHPVS